MFAVVYIPNFFLQATLRHCPELREKPVGLLDESLPKPAIVQLTPAARLEGVTPGMTSTQAMARCREIIIVPRSAVQEQVAADTVLQGCLLFSPYVEVTAPGTYTLDLKGQSHAGDEHFGKKLLALLQNFHLIAQIGVAPTPQVAWYAAHSARSFLKVDRPGEFLNDLPIERLSPPAHLLDILHRWGIGKVGTFLALGKNALAERLGAEVLALFEQVACDQGRPLNLTSPREVFEESFEFENPVESLEGLLFILRRFIEQLALRLTLSSLAAQELVLRLTLEQGDRCEQVFRIPSPTTAVEVLFRMLYTHLENLRTEHPIVGIYLRAEPCRPVHEQFNLFDCILRDPNSFYETMGRLAALLGQERVGTPALLPTHRPDAFQIQPVDFHAPANISEQAWEAFGLPLRRFRPPVPAQVDLRENQPYAVRSSLVHGAIQRTTGPWRSSGQWWDKEPWDRDEWDIQTENGMLYRLYHEAGHWFVEGVYD